MSPQPHLWHCQGGLYAPAWKCRFGNPQPRSPAGSAPAGTPPGAARRAHPGTPRLSPLPVAGSMSAPPWAASPLQAGVPPGLTLARRCAMTNLSRHRTWDMSVCSRFWVSSHLVSPSTRAWHSSHRNLSVFSARCKTLPRSARAKRGVEGHSCPLSPPQHPPALQPCCPPTRTFHVLFLPAFSPLGSLHLSPCVIPSKVRPQGRMNIISGALPCTTPSPVPPHPPYKPGWAPKKLHSFCQTPP